MYVSVVMKRQKTLLDFTIPSTSQGPTAAQSQADSVSCSDSEDEQPSPQKRRVSGQINKIQVDRAQGGTTIIINNSSDPAPQEQLQNTSTGGILFSELPSDVAASPNQQPCQPKLKHFPITVIGSKQRVFNSDWYKSYSWLEYSVERDAAFCFPCRLFAVNEGRSQNTFTKAGFRDWKHATGKGGILSTHDKCSSHTSAMVAWSQYKLNAKHCTSIADRMESNRAEIISSNRHYLKTLIQILLLCAQQEIGLRGHREGSNAKNKGNFLEILHLVASHDPIVQQRLSGGPRNAIYTSPEIQNSLIHIMGELVTKTVCSEVHDAGVFSVLADETKDCSKSEQMAIVLRYVNIKEATIHERFLTYVQVSDLDAKSLSDYILTTLKSHHLDLHALISQGYDGASVMSGRCSGVQQRIMDIAPQAIYVHCFAHVLNLVLVDCAKNVTCASEFFALLESLYVFLSSTKAHVIFVRQQTELHPDKAKRELVRLSDTRWACRYISVNTVCHTFDAVLATLTEIADGDDAGKAVSARGLLSQVKCFSFILILVIFDRVLSCTKQLSDLLQSQQCDLAKAVDLILATIETLEEFRSDASWSHLFSYVQQVAELNEIAITSYQQKRQRRLPHRYEEGVILESVAPPLFQNECGKWSSTAQENRANQRPPR